MLLEKAKVEVKNSISKARKLLKYTEGQEIGPVAPFAAVIPRKFAEVFHTYLEAPLQIGESHTWNFSDIVAFLRCEVLMQLYSASPTELGDFGLETSSNSSQVFAKLLPKPMTPIQSGQLKKGKTSHPPVPSIRLFWMPLRHAVDTGLTCSSLQGLVL